MTEARLIEINALAEKMISFDPPYYHNTAGELREMKKAIQELLLDRMVLLNEIRNLRESRRSMEGSATHSSGCTRPHYGDVDDGMGCNGGQ